MRTVLLHERAAAMLGLVLLGLISCTSGELRPGCGLNLFGRFGYLSISMRVVPRNDVNNTWLFREPVVDVFRNLKPVVKSMPRKNSSFHGDFHLEFCDDLSQLLQAYFREFSIELLERPWEAFTGSWSEVTLARTLGLNASFVGAGHCYVLVRVARVRQAGSAVPPTNPALQDAVAGQAAAVRVGDVPSVAEFVRRFGSHFIASYKTGNSVFQIFVYTPEVYNKIKGKLQNSGISSLATSELSSLFSPWYAEHLGQVLSASGNSTVSEWAKVSLQTKAYIIPYISLLKLHGDSKLLKELDFLLGNEALLNLNLKSLTPVFKEEEKKKWFEEVIDNNLKLWEVNL